MLREVKRKVRHRLAERELSASGEQDSPYFSRFGGLWTDRRDAEDEIGRRLDAGRVEEGEAEQLRRWIARGYVIFERGVEPAVCDQLRADVDEAFAHGDERLLIFPPGRRDPQPLSVGHGTERARVVDVYAFYESARAALFSDAIARFLRIIFDEPPLLFQSLTFPTGSGQGLHQDTQFVVTTSPLEFAASWIALEDIRHGSGELSYIEGSHRIPEYVFGGKYKHWSEKRDGEAGAADWRRHVEHHADRMGLEEKRFLPRKGDVLIWAADLVHGGSPVIDPSLTRKSLVGHYCPDRVDPFYFRLQPDRRTKAAYREGRYASQHYSLAT